MAAKCDICGQEMKEGGGCVPHAFLDKDGKAYRCKPHGEDWQDMPGVDQATKDALKQRNCHDCNAAPGQFHHPGCDMERCPKCGGQAISCDCDLPNVEIIGRMNMKFAVDLPGSAKDRRRRLRMIRLFLGTDGVEITRATAELKDPGAVYIEFKTGHRLHPSNPLYDKAGFTEVVCICRNVKLLEAALKKKILWLKGKRRMTDYMSK